MVEETIQAVKETEAQAENILADAKVRQREILEQAKEDAIHLKEDHLAKAKAKAGTDLEAVLDECDKAKADQQQNLEAEISLLKEMALRKKEEAMDLVIEELI